MFIGLNIEPFRGTWLLVINVWDSVIKTFRKECTLAKRNFSEFLHTATTCLMSWALGSRHDHSSSQGSSSLSSFGSWSFWSGGSEEPHVNSSHVPDAAFLSSSDRRPQTRSENHWPNEESAEAEGDHKGRRLTFSCAINHRPQRSADFSSPTTCPTRPICNTRSRTPWASIGTSSPCKYRLTISM